MSTEGILIGVVVTLAAILYIALPLVRRAATRAESDAALMERQRERLQVYYDRVMTNIRDLDEDHATGKIAPDEYEAERAVWKARGVQVLKALDDLEAQAQMIPASATDDAAIDHAIDDAIEAAIAAYRGKGQEAS
jgi:hypothetical protein